jgi:hypothetical protein
MAVALRRGAASPRSRSCTALYISSVVRYRKDTGARDTGRPGLDAARFDATVAMQSVLLLATARAAAWSPNILFWSVGHAAAVATDEGGAVITPRADLYRGSLNA